ncbi:MAG: endonuclease/exonuclease/phosphatase family protein [Cyclobacteriaceae bacterium]|nr:endonuclease/exonuclease/phosphatase family protein [Cyclobacteriaceae bacterium]
MLRFLPGLLLSFVLMTSFAQPLRVMSYNIRYDNPSDGPNSWPYRKDFLVAQVRSVDADILGVQESLPSQVEYLAAELPAYGRAGRGRDENGTGESTIIFFRIERFEMTESGIFWLSETPEKMSKGWDAAIRRICTYVRLKDRNTGQPYLVLNTHFDHVGAEARKRSAELLLGKMKQMNKAGHPVILLGDFNATPESEPVGILKSKLKDARLSAAQVTLPQPGSFNAFDSTKPAESLIDHVFVSPEFQVERYALLVEMREGRYPSDHFPIVVDLRPSSERR